MTIYTYEKYVEKLIREKYTVSDELAILRQRDTKPLDFASYNEYCEQCKIKAKHYIKNLEMSERAKKHGQK